MITASAPLVGLLELGEVALDLVVHDQRDAPVAALAAVADRQRRRRDELVAPRPRSRAGRASRASASRECAVVLVTKRSARPSRAGARPPRARRRSARPRRRGRRRGRPAARGLTRAYGQGCRSPGRAGRDSPTARRRRRCPRGPPRSRRSPRCQRRRVGRLANRAGLRVIEAGIVLELVATAEAGSLHRSEWGLVPRGGRVKGRCGRSLEPAGR